MPKGKTINLSFLLGIAVFVLVLTGDLMVFLPMLISEGSYEGLTGVITFPGLAVVFGGNHSVSSSLTIAGITTSFSVEGEFKFNMIGLLAMILPIVGAIFVSLNNFVTKKIHFFDIIGILLIVVGCVFCFFIKSDFAQVNELNNDFKYGIGLILMIVFFGISLIVALFKLFLVDFKK